MKYKQFVKKFGLKGKKSPIYKNEGKNAFAKVMGVITDEEDNETKVELVVIFGATVVDKNATTVGQLKIEDEEIEVSEITKNVFIIGGAAPAGEITF